MDKEDIKFAIFNRLKDDEAKDDEIYVYEFKEPLEFYLDTSAGDEPTIYSNRYDIKFNELILPPQRFYNAVLEVVKEKVANGEMSDLVLLKRSEVNEE